MFQRISHNVFAYLSSNNGSNVFLLKSQKIALIDSSLEENSFDLQNALEKAGVKPKQVDFVLHTHGHADHFGCSWMFKKAKLAMSSFDGNHVNRKDAKFTASYVLKSTAFPSINYFFSFNESIDLGGFKLKVISTPGHTFGSVCFFEEKQGLLFSGDTLFNGDCGRTDLQSGNRAQLIKSLKKLQQLNFKILLPGHGPLLERNQEKNLESVLNQANSGYY